jgi:hypothetical protein
MNRTRSWMVAAAAAGVLATAPLDVEAQGRRDRERDRERASTQVIIGGSGVRIEQAPRAGQGGAPAFCRSGAGHPVHGRQWCVRKGFGLGTQAGRWQRATWGDVVFRSPRRSGAMGRDVLVDVLGRDVVVRLDGRARAAGARGPLSGRWVLSDGARVLMVSAGGVPIAELVDLNGNGRADLVLLSQGR